MATFSDDFNRSNRSLSGDNGWRTGARNSNLSISGNQITNSDWSFHSYATAFGNTQFAQLDIVNLGARGWLGVQLRAQDSSGNCGQYILYADAAVPRYVIIRLDGTGNTPVEIGSLNETLPATPFTLRAEASGSSLVLKANGVTKVSISDSTWLTGGYVGIYAEFDTTFNAVVGDNFSGGDLVTSTGICRLCRSHY